ncbi:MAG: hypothetical protein F2563_05165 [Actinobacteria bacterium]|uniref:Unannotated protein n=1 Tax=freshwater metagenome TaxID=449393 RepID=A0A6J6EZ38_9ZZZZ|nr:hypothetical protein [Actinomycetota bacterium]
MKTEIVTDDTLSLKVKDFNNTLAQRFKKKALLEIPAVAKELELFFNKNSHSIEEVSRMKEIITDAENLLGLMKNYIHSHIEVS